MKNSNIQRILNFLRHIKLKFVDNWLSLKRWFGGHGHGFVGFNGPGGFDGFNGLVGFGGFDGFSEFGGFVF